MLPAQALCFAAQQVKYGDVLVASVTFDFDASSWSDELVKHAEGILLSFGLSLVSHEQVEQELALMGAAPPLSMEQLSELSERLKVGACIDVIGSLCKVRRSKWQLIVCARWLDSGLRLFTRGGVSKREIESADAFISSHELPEVLKHAISEAFSAMLRSQPVRSQVQLQLPNGTIHIMGGKRAGWRKDSEVAICRRTYNHELKRNEWQVIGFAKITAVETYYAVARPIEARFSTRNPDEAVSLFIVPKELSHLAQRR